MTIQREYLFDLPQIIPGWKIVMGRSEIQEFPGYDEIPEDLRTRLEEATMADSVEVTQDDLDRLPDPFWTAASLILNLPWQHSST